MTKQIRFGVVGVCGGYGRGSHMIASLNSVPPVKVVAICDIDKARLDKANESLGVEQVYYNYDEMLDKANLDAVFIATPMNLHAPQSIAALKRGVHVLCEVTAAVSLQECKDLVAACKTSKAVYMMAENYNYNSPVMAVQEMVKRGLFGTPYYAEGGYLADCKGLAELTPWRRKWQVGINGITYVTHNLGPILLWMPGERVVSVCCSGAGHHYRDPRGMAYEAEASSTMMAKTTSGNQIVIRSDFLSTRPGGGVYYTLQGTEGSYECLPGLAHRIWLRSKSQEPQWLDMKDVEPEFLPDRWKDAVAKGMNVSADYFQTVDFVNAILGKALNPIGVHESLDLTIPGLVSQLSIAEGGRWMTVPDSRMW